MAHSQPLRPEVSALCLVLLSLTIFCSWIDCNLLCVNEQSGAFIPYNSLEPCATSKFTRQWLRNFCNVVTILLRRLPPAQVVRLPTPCVRPLGVRTGARLRSRPEPVGASACRRLTPKAPTRVGCLPGVYWGVLKRTRLLRKAMTVACSVGARLTKAVRLAAPSPPWARIASVSVVARPSWR